MDKSPKYSLRLYFGVVLALMLAVVSTITCGCSHKQDAAVDTTEPRVEKLSYHRINVEMTLDPPRVDFTKAVLLSIRATCPSEYEVTIPDITDRLEGFTVAGSYDQHPPATDGTATIEKHVRLTPIMAKRYRIAPMAIEYTDLSRSPAVHGWFPTKPVVMSVRDPAGGKTPDDIDDTLEPKWIPPTFKTILGWTGIGAAGLILLFLLILLLRKIRDHVEVMRLSPRERALRELKRLLGKNLIARNRVKDFYVELTMIVRRYIERFHKIRAPEQTTDEFLQAVSEDPRFPANTVEKLQSFLQAADLVKFAAYHPSGEKIDNAVNTAREYIEEKDDHAPRTEDNARRTP